LNAREGKIVFFAILLKGEGGNKKRFVERLRAAGKHKKQGVIVICSTRWTADERRNSFRGQGEVRRGRGLRCSSSEHVQDVGGERRKWQTRKAIPRKRFKRQSTAVPRKPSSGRRKP